MKATSEQMSAGDAMIVEHRKQLRELLTLIEETYLSTGFLPEGYESLKVDLKHWDNMRFGDHAVIISDA